MLIKGFQKTTLLDYPGKIACILFVSGCNFRCPFCHNRELVLPSLSKRLKTYKVDLVFDFLEKRKGKLEAVVITGGEPTLNPDLPEFIKKIKSRGFSVKLDTNGTNPEMIRRLVKEKLIDYAAIDFKGPLNKYVKYTNTTNKQINIQRNKYTNDKIVKKIKTTIALLVKSGINFELRTTVVPTLHTKEDLKEMAKEIKTIFHNPYYILHTPWFLQQFRPKNCLDPKFGKIEPYNKLWFEQTLKEIRKYFPKVELRK